MKNKKILIISIIAVMAVVLYLVVSNMKSPQINKRQLAKLEGEYRPTDEDLSWMILTIHSKGGMIMDDKSPRVPYLAIFDDEAGEPGVEGKIISLDKDTIVIEIAKDFYESLPDDGWKTTDNDSRLEMHYKKSKDKLILENNGVEMEFYFMSRYTI